MGGNVVVEYEGNQVSVSKEVADFLEEDRRRLEAQGRRNRRWLSKSSFEQLSFLHAGLRETEDDAVRNLRLQSLRKAVSHLRPRDRELISLRYEAGLTMESIGRHRGVSKMAVSKQLKKVHDVLRSSVE